MTEYYIPIIDHCKTRLEDIFWNGPYDPLPPRVASPLSAGGNSLAPVPFPFGTVGGTILDKTEFTFAYVVRRTASLNEYLTTVTSVRDQDDNIDLGSLSLSPWVPIKHDGTTNPSNNLGARGKNIEVDSSSALDAVAPSSEQTSVLISTQPDDANLTPAGDKAAIPSSSIVKHSPSSGGSSSSLKRSITIVEAAKDEQSTTHWQVAPNGKRLKTKDTPHYRSYYEENRPDELHVHYELVYECKVCPYKCSASGDIKKHKDRHLPPQYHCKKMGCPCVGKGLWATRLSSVQRHLKTETEKEKLTLKEAKGTAAGRKSKAINR